MFSGDAYSMGGNGEYVKHSGYALGMASINVPAGPGGGCVKTGPFAKFVISLVFWHSITKPLL